jgi:hypothetical protein
MNFVPDQPPPAMAAEKLAELRDLGERAWHCWMTGDLQGAGDTAAQAMRAASAASAAISVLLEHERRARESDDGADSGGTPGDWLG